ncbi:MAG: NMD3-related protein [Promethearchaeota archaeon]
MPNRFCAICGKIIDKTDPHFGMCLKCYLKENTLFELPDKFSLNVCIDCGSFSKKDMWIKPERNEIFSILEQAIQKHVLNPLLKRRNLEFSFLYDEDSFIYSSKDLLTSLEVLIKGFLSEDRNIQHSQTIKVNINYLLCKNCSNLRGGTYYLSIIQLRVKDEEQFGLIKNIIDEVNEYAENLFKNDPKQYISKIEDQKYGVDLYLSTNELMNQLIKFLRSKYHFLFKRTKKLVGRDNQRGKNLYRFKSLIKLLPVNINDELSIEGHLFRVENIMKNKVIIRDENNTKFIKDYSYFFNEKFTKNNA